MVKYLKLCPLTIAVFFAGLSNLANAQLGQDLSVDLRSLSLGNAVTADPPGISAVHFNPAALAKLDGLQTDVQGILANFAIKRDYSAPARYNIFGYSDDPIVCNDGPEVDVGICTDFKGTVSGDVEYASLYVPILKKIVDVSYFYHHH